MAEEITFVVVRDPKTKGFRARWKDSAGNGGTSTQLFATVGAALHTAERSYQEWRARAAVIAPKR